MFAVGQTIGSCENQLPALLNKHCSCKIPACSVGLKIRVNGSCYGTLRVTRACAQSHDEENCP